MTFGLLKLSTCVLFTIIILWFIYLSLVREVLRRLVLWGPPFDLVDMLFSAYTRGLFRYQVLLNGFALSSRIFKEVVFLSSFHEPLHRVRGVDDKVRQHAALWVEAEFEGSDSELVVTSLYFTIELPVEF